MTYFNALYNYRYENRSSGAIDRGHHSRPCRDHYVCKQHSTH